MEVRVTMLGIDFEHTSGPYIRDTFKHLGIPECADDPRFSTVRRWEHTESFLVELGDDWDRVGALKAKGSSR
jgi:hypothetical protein